jgi:hypothetical protein
VGCTSLMTLIIKVHVSTRGVAQRKVRNERRVASSILSQKRSRLLDHLLHKSVGSDISIYIYIYKREIKSGRCFLY